MCQIQKTAAGSFIFSTCIHILASYSCLAKFLVFITHCIFNLLLPERIWFCKVRKTSEKLLNILYSSGLLEDKGTPSGLRILSDKVHMGNERHLCLYHKSQEIFQNKIGHPQLHVTSNSVLLINITEYEDHVRSRSHHREWVFIVGKWTTECLLQTYQSHFKMSKSYFSCKIHNFIS